jgi:benzoyl-CoA reductase/2-hydroxyglutaryl-CoA dehydratase subunit BcrC/BadD/HgdB
LGCTPIWPAKEATRYGSTILANDLLRYASQHGFTQDCCSIQRLIIGLDSESLLDAPALLISASSFCDFERDLFRTIAHKRRSHEMLLEIPLFDDYYNKVENLKKQLIKMHHKTAKLLGVKADEESLLESVDLSVKIIERMAEINELRTRRDSPKISSELLGFAFSLPYIRGSYESFQIVEQLHQYIIQFLDDKSKQQLQVNENPRILWDLLSDAKGSISNYINDYLVFESLNFLWPKETPLHGINAIAKCKDPYERLARMILSNAAINLDDRIDAMKKGIDLYNLDGIITYQQPHCPLARGWIEMAFQIELNIPLLMLNSDIATGSLTPMTRTRIDAFINFIRTSKKK